MVVQLNNIIDDLGYTTGDLDYDIAKKRRKEKLSSVRRRLKDVIEEIIQAEDYKKKLELLILDDVLEPNYTGIFGKLFKIQDEIEFKGIDVSDGVRFAKARYLRNGKECYEYFRAI